MRDRQCVREIDSVRERGGRQGERGTGGEREDHLCDKRTALSLKIAPQGSKIGDQGPEDTATKKGKGQHGERARSTWADKDPTPWKSHKGSARAAPPNQTRKQPIRQGRGEEYTHYLLLERLYCFSGWESDRVSF